MDSPVVSVVITSYNRARYLAEAVESVLTQTFAAWELIIVDDGSTDNAPQVATRYAQKDERITFIQQANSGVSVARNTGAKQARGEFFAFLDDDDICHPHRLQKQVALLQSRPDLAACVTNFSPIGETTKSASRTKTPWMWQGTGLMFRRQVYLDLGGFRSYFRTSEDVDFFFLFTEKHQYEFIDEVLYFHRKYAPGTSDNLTNAPPLDRFAEMIAAFVSANCRRNDLPDPIDQRCTFADLLPMASSLPAEMRLRLLHLVRNAGRRLLAGGGGNLRQVNDYFTFLGSGDCRQHAQKHRRWLALQCLRYGQMKNAWLFLREQNHA